MDRSADYRLRPGRVFLNHGSFGATPVPVLEAAHAHRADAEADFPGFYHQRVFPALESSRRAVCEHLGVPAGRGVFVRNSTTAMQTAIGHLGLGAGDHLVTTSREYEATLVLVDRLRAGGVEVTVVPGHAAELTARVLEAVTPRTRAVVVSHVTSPWASVNDIDAITEGLSPRGIAVVVDGAHTAGLLPLPTLRPGVFVTLTLHKWLHLPTGAGMLVVPPEAAPSLRPVVSSWYTHDEDLVRRFSWTGTDDVVAHLVGAEAVAYQRDLEQDGLHDHWDKLSTYALDRLLAIPGTTPPPGGPRAPSMVSVPLPTSVDPVALLAELHRRSVDLWCGATAEGPLVRMSVAPYTTAEDVDRGLSILEDVLRAA